MQAFFIIAFILSIQFLPAQTAELDPQKWAVELSKKDRGVYDSLFSLAVRLEKVDSIKAFQFLDAEPKTLTSKPHRPAYGSDGDYFSKPNAEDVFDTVYSVMSEYDPDKYPSIY